ncbi:MAG: 3D domain-containing protein [Phycisphaerales bacterium]|nr:3D domain-containing protein [Phycisphaerales bacterium]
METARAAATNRAHGQRVQRAYEAASMMNPDLPEDVQPPFTNRRGWWMVGAALVLMVVLVGVFVGRGGPRSAEASGAESAVGQSTYSSRVDDGDRWHEMWVIATAYNSLAEQTDDTPDIAAWNDKLVPGMKAIAVSRDLLDLGLTRNVEVWIEGCGGPYRVLDKMNKRWKDRIDVYMGVDRKRALAWGKKRVRIRWRTPTEDG